MAKNKIQRIDQEISKVREKIAGYQDKLKTLEAQKTEAENLEIVQMVRALRLTPEQLNAMLSGGTVPAWPLPPPTTTNRRTTTMKNKRIFKTFSALCAALVLMMGLSVTAFAQGTDQPPAEDTTNDTNVVVEETEDSPALTPDGNAALVDDFGGNKQLITVTTKAGNYFYILIDRANEDKETAVHFLNQVDEADLMALMEDGQTTQEQPATCTCTEKCVAGAVNTACPVCATNMSGCTGKEPEPETPEETPEPEEPAQNATGLNPALLLAALALLGGGGAFAYFKFIKNKPKTKGNDNLDDYDYGEDDTDQEDEDPWETEESDKPDADGGGDEESEDKAD